MKFRAERARVLRLTYNLFVCLTGGAFSTVAETSVILFCRLMIYTIYCVLKKIFKQYLVSNR